MNCNHASAGVLVSIQRGVRGSCGASVGIG